MITLELTRDKNPPHVLSRTTVEIELDEDCTWMCIIEAAIDAARALGYTLPRTDDLIEAMHEVKSFEGGE